MNDNLTADEIRSMEAGRGMDALLAEWVMGWHQFSYDDDSSTMDDVSEIWYEPDHNGHCWKGEPYEIGGRYDHSFKRWSPSGDIAAVWEVHRAMLSRDPQTKTRYLYALADMLIDKFVGRSRPPSVWTALLEYFDEDTICRAALLAVAEANERVKQIDCV